NKSNKLKVIIDLIHFLKRYGEIISLHSNQYEIESIFKDYYNELYLKQNFDNLLLYYQSLMENRILYQNKSHYIVLDESIGFNYYLTHDQQITIEKYIKTGEKYSIFMICINNYYDSTIYNIFLYFFKLFLFYF